MNRGASPECSWPMRAAKPAHAGHGRRRGLFPKTKAVGRRLLLQAPYVSLTIIRCRRRSHSMAFKKLFRIIVDRKSTRLNSSHSQISYAVFCLKKKNKHTRNMLELLTDPHSTTYIS